MTSPGDFALLSDIFAMTRGWSGLLIAYAAVQVPMLIGMARAQAPVRHWSIAPVLAAPLAVAAGLCVSAVGPLLPGGSAVSTALLRLTLGTGLNATFGYAAGRYLARRVPSPRAHRRGTLITVPEPGASPGADRLVREGAVTIAGIPVHARDETKHFKLIGATGTGKSTAIRELLCAALQRGDRAIIADPDGGYLKAFHDQRRADVILNPFDRDSVKWDLFGEITDEHDVEQLAHSLIPDHDGADRSWRGYARTFFVAVTRQAYAAGLRDVAELNRLLLVAGTDELRRLVEGTPAQPFLEENNGRMFESIRSVTSSAVGGLSYIARQRGKLFSVRDWVAGGGQPGRQGGVLFIPYRAGQIAALRSTISAWMRVAIFEAMNREEGDQRLWFIVDELDALGKIDGLKDALARLRKFGGRCVLGFQSISQVSSTYGAGEAQTIVENCGNTLILRCSASEYGGTSRFASQLIGCREVARSTESRSWRATDVLPSTTRSEHVSIEPAVMDSEIEQLADLRGYLKLASRPNWELIALNPLPLQDPRCVRPAVAPVTDSQAESEQAARICSAARRHWRERCRSDRGKRPTRQAGQSMPTRTRDAAPGPDWSKHE